MEKQNAELKDWIKQLEEAKEYFLSQIANLEKENQDLREKMNQYKNKCYSTSIQC